MARLPSLLRSIREGVSRRGRIGLVAGAVVTLIIAAGAGLAFAYFTSSGAGTGSATAGSAQAITVTAVSSPAASANLYPGGSAVAVNFTVNNPNSYAVSFTGWSSATLSKVTPVGSNTCTTSDFQIAAASGSFSPALSIPANTPSLPGVSGIANSVVDLATTAQNGCQGATVTVTLTLTGGKSS